MGTWSQKPQLSNLTKNVDSAAHNVVPVLDDVIKEFTWQFYKATGFSGKLDTIILLS